MPVTQNEDVLPTRLINYWGSQLIALTSVLEVKYTVQKMVAV